MSFRDELRSALIESFKHRACPDEACAICAGRSAPLAFHVFEYAQPETDPCPPGFVAMSSSRGTLRGTFPVCKNCAPACSKCGLPIKTGSVRSFYRARVRTLNNDEQVLLFGNGLCLKHFHPIAALGHFLR